ncbi:MAG: hypothetical protein N2Z72_01675 [Bacteroidales bacterium]|nr:hypothetical protein [Bacteroidales bacterium]
MEEVLKLIAKLDLTLQTYFQAVFENKTKWMEEKAFLQAAIDDLQKELLQTRKGFSHAALPTMINREEIKTLIQDIDTCLTYLKEE